MSKILGTIILVLLSVIVPLIIKAEDVCEESRNRVDVCLEELTQQVGAGQCLTSDMVDSCLRTISLEPDIYFTEFVVGIRMLHNDGEDTSYDILTEELYGILDTLGELVLSEGDVFSAKATLKQAGFFTRLSGRSFMEGGFTLTSGCRIGRRSLSEKYL